jgi:tetratricopeptide (TPR) repeat protein
MAPDNEFVRQALGTLYLAAGEPDKAEAEYAKALALTKEPRRILLERARINRDRREDHDAAIADYIELVRDFALSKQDLPHFDLVRARTLVQEFQ